MRKSIITRTISYRNLKIMVVDTKERKVSEMTVKFTGNENRTDKILDSIELPENMQAVSIISSEEVEELYGMYEEDFLKYAVKMNNRFEKIK